ncbi:hypothetical protein MYXO_03971 [Myxococcaceae bacterium]|nr:hypothetical protein MYXO_03971 [Myxococcaceae bacterium]
MKAMIDATYRHARRVVIAVVGGSVVAIGIAMLVLPGPAFVVIPIGLGILAIEFAWAKRWLEQVKTHAQGAVDAVKRRGGTSLR